MTDKNIKIMLLASLITAIVLPLSAVSAANADAELTDSERRFEQFIMLAEQQQKLQMIVDGLIDQDESSDIISNLEKRIDSLQKRMDVMQQQEIDSVSMDSEELESLTAKGYVILDEVTNPTSIHFIDKDADFFVDQSTKQIIVVVDDKPPDGILGQGTPAGNSDAQREHTIGDVSFLVDKIKQSSSVVTCDEREKDCRYGLGGIAIKQGRETSSLGFSAKQVDGDRGFVTVSHGVNYKGAIVKQYPSRDIGTVDVITKDDRTECDCAFVKVTNDDFKSNTSTF